MIMPAIHKLQYISANCNDIEKACQAGVRWVQLRIKDISYSELKKIALQTQAICKKNGAVFILNDHVELALEIEADGVHLGKQDMSPSEARSRAGRNFIIGATANSIDDIRYIHQSGASDYIGLGPFRFTTTKKNLSPLIGLQGYQKILSEYATFDNPLPVIAIGGIQVEDIQLLATTPVYGIAVSSGISNAPSVEAAAGSFITTINTYMQ